MLVNRGRVVTILIQPSLMESDSLSKMNLNKRGKPFKFCSALISAAFAVKCTLRLAYRQLEGFIKDVSSGLKLAIPNFRTIWWRIDRMENEGIKLNISERKNLIVAIDSTGLRPVNDGEYRAMKYDKRREWIKLHAVVDVKTKEILSIKITKGNTNDCTEFEEVMGPISQNVSSVFADKAYDTVKIFDFCAKNGIFAGIPVKLNASNHNKSKHRRDAIMDQVKMDLKRGSCRLNRYLTREQREKNQEEWKLRVGYGRRVLIESAFSRYKRVVGETLFSRKEGNIEKEVIAKINLSNQFIG
jgi:transposase